jgi:dTDP-4-dehydrorhamnose reductase
VAQGGGMRVLVLGADGMLGHRLLKTLSTRAEIAGTLREENFVESLQSALKLKGLKLFAGVTCEQPQSVKKIFSQFRPEVVINCIGWVKQRTQSETLDILRVNAVFPQQLAQWSEELSFRLVQLSTDCVFSGKKGNYTENDIADAEDLYGVSKYLGEVRDSSRVLTLRTSIIGLELKNKKSLVEWFLSSRVPVSGFEKAVFSGLSTSALSEIIWNVLKEQQTLSGLYHVSAPSISKYELLLRIKNEIQFKIEVIQDQKLVIDRSLDSDRFFRETNIQKPNWDAMITDLGQEIRQRGFHENL